MRTQARRQRPTLRVREARGPAARGCRRLSGPQAPPSAIRISPRCRNTSVGAVSRCRGAQGDGRGRASSTSESPSPGRWTPWRRVGAVRGEASERCAALRAARLSSNALTSSRRAGDARGSGRWSVVELRGSACTTGACTRDHSLALARSRAVATWAARSRRERAALHPLKPKDAAGPVGNACDANLVPIARPHPPRPPFAPPQAHPTAATDVGTTTSNQGAPTSSR